MLNFDNNDIFIAFRLPNDKDFYVIKQNDKAKPLAIDEIFSKKGFYFYPFDINGNNAQPVFINADNIYINKKFSFHTNKIDNNADTTYEKYLELAQAFIEATKIQYRKLVLSRTKDININQSDMYAGFMKACNKYPKAFVYLFNHPAHGTWMGATPEILLSKKDDSYRTLALAGTQFVSDPTKVTWDIKEVEEQKAVMDFIENTLLKYNLDFNATEPYTKIAAKNNDGYLVHIATDYSFSATKDILSRLLLDLHPTPAVSGFPQKEAIKFIRENENYDREFYTGFAGAINIISDNTFDIFVNLRTMKVFKNKLRLYLGGGINNMSIAEKEWQETENKAKTLMELV